MRLTCPNCGAEYEVPEGQIPAAGKHVQCTACHTRWFARAPQAALSEDQILARLETRGPRPRPTLVAVPEPEETAPGDDEQRTEEAVPEDATPKEPVPDAGCPQARPSFSLTPATPVSTEWKRPPSPLPDAESDRGPPRDTGRLRLDTAAPERAPMPPVSRFGRGLLVALALGGVAIATYVWRAPLAATAPPAASALEAYGAAIDGAREWLDQHLTPSR